MNRVKYVCRAPTFSASMFASYSLVTMTTLADNSDFLYFPSRMNSALNKAADLY